MNTQLYLKGVYRLLLIYACFQGQTGRSQDTIPINLYKSTQLIFNDDIENIIIGTGDLQIKKEELGKVLILIASATENDFVPTNLYVSTKQGYHYNFILDYVENPTNWILPIDVNLAKIKPENFTKQQQIDSVTIDVKDKNKEIITALLEDKRKVKRYFEKFDDIYFKYINHFYLEQHIYYKLEITNESNQDFIIDYVKVFIDTIGRKGDTKKSKTRKLLLANSDYSEIFGKKIINPKETIIILLKFNKIFLNKEQSLSFDLKEKEGNRDLSLNLRSILVNDPYALKL